MITLSPELADILRRIAAAEVAAGGDVRFRPFFAEQADGPVRVIPSVQGSELLQAGRMFALRELGFLEIEPAREGSSEFGAFRITAAGRDASARYREPAAGGAAAASTMDTSWACVRPVLVSVVQQWEQEGARDAIDIETLASTLAPEMTAAHVRIALELLERDGWLQAEYEAGTDGPIAVTPEPKVLQLLRDWPIEGRDTAIADALLDALDNAMEGASDPEEKTRLQKLRAAAGDVGKSVLAGAIVAAGKAVAGG